MKISAKIDYACRALVELALHWPNTEPVSITTIAQKQKIPIKFLVHILINLKNLGYVQSTRGNKGGYRLTKNPSDINLLEVIQNFKGTFLESENNHKNSVMGSIWQEFQSHLLEKIGEINFEIICHRQRQYDKIANFEI